MSKFFLYELSIEDLPQNTKRDKDLLEVISLLKDIPRIEQAYVSTDFERLDLSGLWILDKNYSIEEIKILERLKRRRQSLKIHRRNFRILHGCSKSVKRFKNQSR